MKRDPTVLLSLGVFAIAWGLSRAWEMPNTLTSDDPPQYHILFWILFACAIRAIVLWYQTLVHAVRNQPTDSRVGWVIGHVLLGFLTSYLYYFVVKPRGLGTSRPTSSADSEAATGRS